MGARFTMQAHCTLPWRTHCGRQSPKARQRMTAGSSTRGGGAITTRGLSAEPRLALAFLCLRFAALPMVD